MFFKNEDVGEPGEGRVICNYARKSDLFFAFVNSEIQRIFKRSFHSLKAAAQCPVGPLRKKLVNQTQLKLIPVCADPIFATTPFLRHGSELSHAASLFIVFRPVPSWKTLYWSELTSQSDERLRGRRSVRHHASLLRSEVVDCTLRSCPFAITNRS